MISAHVDPSASGSSFQKQKVCGTRRQTETLSLSFMTPVSVEKATDEDASVSLCVSQCVCLCVSVWVSVCVSKHWCSRTML